MELKLPDPKSPLRIGTRGSPLALAQAYETRERLSIAFGLSLDSFEIVVIKTTGDKVLNRPLKEIGGKGLFTKEIEEALLQESIDIAVHSMKDMPVQQPDGLILDTFLPREDVRDAFVSRIHKSLADIPQGATVGTSSLRRKAQLMSKRPDLKIVEFRGNVQTRLKKLDDGVAECTFLAVAGLNRLKMEDIITAPISTDEMLPAVAQGAIGIERREKDIKVATILEAIHNSTTGLLLSAERAFLEALDGSCETPIAGLAEFKNENLRFRGEILKTDGSEVYSDEQVVSKEDATLVGIEMAHKLLSQAGNDFFS
ncbi:MAG: hydroxymethylbilane synthase [Paracoccaceae bacterium]|jgi:hydroxymethylbilane synthase|nr:hydroxymethylbilane synthase [Rhodobacterales bacterium]NCX69084.1 hydroxymethylbilane synthase [Paracoccaceae bacterium]NCX90865.1 hydroxymethylbilane synthase [Paracoccaceae bacterium]